MRLLDLSEYWLVAGGDGSDEIPTVVVTAPAPSPPPPYYPPPPPPYYPPPPPPPPYSGGGGSTPPPPPPCIHTSPPPSLVPQGVNLNDLRNNETALAGNILKLDTSIEHGAFIYADAAGNFRTGAIAHGDSFHVDVPLDIHAGERVVSFVHSHPQGGNGAKYPSQPGEVTSGLADTQVVAQNRQDTSHFDPNYLTAIVDSQARRVYEYSADIGSGGSLTGRSISYDCQ